MMNVLLVDDEPWALSGLENSFDWNALGFQVIARTLDAREALRIARAERPDVIISDIRMPELTGLELLNAIRQIGLDTEFLIVSGYDDFKYAQEAIRCGVFAYLLKPIQITEGKELLRRLHRHIVYKRSVLSSSDVSALLNRLAQGYGGKFGHLFEDHGLSPIYARYQVAIILNTSVDTFADCIPDIEQSLHFSIGRERTLVIMNTACPMDGSIKRWLESSLGSYAIIALSALAMHDDEMLTGLQQAEMALTARFIHPETRFFRYQPPSPEFVLAHDFAERFVCALRSREPATSESMLNGLPKYARLHDIAMEELGVLYNLINAAIRENIHTNIPSDGNEETLIHRYANVDSMAAHMLRYLNPNSLQQIESSCPTLDTNILLTYIRQHLSENLNLEQLSLQFHLTSTYLSERFKQITGQTFRQYLIEQRLYCAQRLLLETTMDIEQITTQVGYNDYFYFIKAFNKAFGMTPTQYRKVESRNEASD